MRGRYDKSRRKNNEYNNEIQGNYVFPDYKCTGCLDSISGQNTDIWRYVFLPVALI